MSKQHHEANALQNAKQPADTGCFAEAEASKRYKNCNTSTPICQVDALACRTVARLEKAGLETVGDVAAILEDEGDEGLLNLKGVGPKSLQEVKEAMALESKQAPLTLDDIQRRIEGAARRKARGLVTDLLEAKGELADAEQEYAETIEQAEKAVRAAEARITEIEHKAESMTDEAVDVLGMEAQVMLDQIVDARARALAGAQADLGAAREQAEALREERDQAVAEIDELIGVTEDQISELIEASPSAAEVVQEARQVEALVAEAEAFLQNGHRNAADLERLMSQLSRCAQDYVLAAQALADLQAHAETWFADQLREEIEALKPSPSFPEEVEEITARAEEAGVGRLIKDAVDAAKARDRRALARKGREARLYAQSLARTSTVEPGDVIAHTAGHVTVYRPIDSTGQFKIAQAYRYVQEDGRWLWEPHRRLVGRKVNQIRGRKTATVQ